MSKTSPPAAQGILTLQQREQYAYIFVQLDTNADGWLSRAECAQWIRSQDFQQSEQQIETIFRMIDTNVDGRITLDEFFSTMELVHQPPTKNTAAENMFKSMDRNGDGLLSVEELHRGLNKSGYSVSREQVQKFVYNLDTNMDGEISYDEFLVSFKDD